MKAIVQDTYGSPDDGEVAGVAPLAAESASVVSSKTGLSEARTDILGVDGQSMNAFDHPTTTAGKMLFGIALGFGLSGNIIEQMAGGMPGSPTRSRGT